MASTQIIMPRQAPTEKCYLPPKRTPP